MRKLLIAAVPVVILAVAAMPGMARDRREIPAATPAGKPESCIPLRSIRQLHVRSDQVIDFEMNGGKVYRNTLPNSCPSLGFEERFAYATSLSQLCSVDLITVLQSPPIMAGAHCGLGQFQPATLAKRAKR